MPILEGHSHVDEHSDRFAANEEGEDVKATIEDTNFSAATMLCSDAKWGTLPAPIVVIRMIAVVF